MTYNNDSLDNEPAKAKTNGAIAHTFSQRVYEITEKGPNIETPNFINQNKKAFGTATSATKDDFQYETLGKHEKSAFTQNMLDFVFQNLNVPQPLHALCSDLMTGDLNTAVSNHLFSFDPKAIQGEDARNLQGTDLPNIVTGVV